MMFFERLISEEWCISSIHTGGFVTELFMIVIFEDGSISDFYATFTVLFVFFSE
jgi:hypothetical protein